MPDDAPIAARTCCGPRTAATPPSRSRPRRRRCSRPGSRTPTRAVAAGAGGATAVSDDGGRNYAPIGGDIAGSFQFGLRPGPTDQIAFALGARGQLARTTDNGTTWRAINVATSADMRDTSFSSADDGYALDQRGGLFRTANGGASWQPIDPGTTAAPRAVITRRRRRPAGRPARRPARRRRRRVLARRPARPQRRRRPVRPRRLGDLRLRRDGDRPHHQLRSPWTTIKGPTSGKRSAAAARRRHDVGLERLRARQLRPRVAHDEQRPALDRAARASAPTTGSRSRSARPSSGYLTLGSYPADGDVAYVLRTTDSGRHWRPQRIASGALPRHRGRDQPVGVALVRADLDAGGGQRRLPQPVHHRHRR